MTKIRVKVASKVKMQGRTGAKPGKIGGKDKASPGPTRKAGAK